MDKKQMANKKIYRTTPGKFKQKLSNAIGDSLRKPMAVSLGWINENGEILLRVPDSRGDQPGRFYFHEITGQAFVGMAYLAEGVLDSAYIRYGMPVRVQKDILTKDWVITGLDPRLSAEYMYGVSTSDTTLINGSQIKEGLIRETSPRTMSAKLLSGAFRYGDEWKFLPDTYTVSFSSSPYSSQIPSTPDEVCYVLVQRDWVLGTVSYKYGALVDATMPFINVAQVDNGSGTYLPQTDIDNFRYGYLKLSNGMSSFKNSTNIYPLQEFYTLSRWSRFKTGVDTDLPISPVYEGDTYWASDTSKLYIANEDVDGWVDISGSALSSLTLNALTDVTITSPANNNILIYSSGQWINSPISTYVPDQIEELFDVDFDGTTRVKGDIFVWSNGSWRAFAASSNTGYALVSNPGVLKGLEWRDVGFNVNTILTDSDGNVVSDSDGNVLVL